MTTLNNFSDSLETLKNRLISLDTQHGWYQRTLKINVSELSSITPEQIAEFLGSFPFPNGCDTFEIASLKVGDDCKTIMELIERTKQSNVKCLRLVGEFGSLPFEQFQMLMESILKTSWIKKLDLSRNRLESLTDETLLTLGKWFRQSKGFKALHLSGNGLETRPVHVLSDFVENITQAPNVISVSVWDEANCPVVSQDWTKEEHRALINLNLRLISKLSTSHSNSGPPKEKSPISGLVPKQEECELLCQLMDQNSDNDCLGRAILRWVKDNFSEDQRFSLAENYLKLDDDNIKHLKSFNLNHEQRLALFLRHGSKALIGRLCSFDKLTEDVFVDNIRLEIFDCEFQGRPFIDAWKVIDNDNLLVLEEGFDECNADLLKTDIIKNLLPALEQANKTVWKQDDFPKLCFEQLKKRLEKSELTDPVHFHHTFRSIQLLQWYTWFMSNIAKLKLEKPAVLSPLLKELAGYPDHTMRYQLSQALLQILETSRGQDLYYSLTQKEQGSSTRKKQSSSLFLPEILLTGIILGVFSKKDGDEKERKEGLEQAELPELLRIAQEISAVLSNKYDNGHYMRALISSVRALSLDKTLSAEQKLSLIRNLLQPDPQSLIVEKMIEAFFKSLKGKSIQAGALKEKLTQLLGDQSDKILADFSRYFPNEPKQLTSKEVTRISRGVLEKFRKLEREKAFREQLSNWYLVEGLSLLGEIAVLAEKTPEKYRKTLYETFQKIFKLNNEQLQFYADTFSNQRNEAAILTYLGKIRSLKGEESKVLEETFRSIIGSLLTENQSLFYQQRYDSTHHKHLEVVFAGCPNLNRLWPQNQKLDFNAFLDKNHISFKPFKPDLAKFITNKICQHNHLNVADYPILKRYLDNIEDNKIKEEIKENLEVELKRLQSLPSEGGVKDPKIELRLQLQLTLIQLIESSQVADQKTCITKALSCLSKLREGTEFSNDLRALNKNFDNARYPLDLNQSKEWRLVFTDHYWDLFMSGTDVEGSCQRVDGEPSLNRCLSAYVKDGKIKMIAIQDGTGKTIARCMVRLLWDEQDRIPVLYLEEAYPYFLRSEQTLAIEKFAIHLAEDWNIPLVSANSTESSMKYPNPLVSLSGVGPEYVDAIHQPTEEGVFSIPHSQILFKPSLERAFDPKFSAHFTWQEKSMLPEGFEVKKLGEIARRGVERKQLVEEDTVTFERADTFMIVPWLDPIQGSGGQGIVGEKLRESETTDRKELSEVAKVFGSADRLQLTSSQDLARQFQSVATEFNQLPSIGLSFGVTEGEALLPFLGSSRIVGSGIVEEGTLDLPRQVTTTSSPVLLLSSPGVTPSETGLKSQPGRWSRRELTEQEWDTVLKMTWEPSFVTVGGEVLKVQTAQKITFREAYAFKEKLAMTGININNDMIIVGDCETGEFQVEISHEAQLALANLHQEFVTRPSKATRVW